MFYKVVTLTLVLLVQITYQGKLRSRRNQMHFINQSNHYFGQNKSRNARQYGFISKWFNNNHRAGRYQNSKPKSRFLEVMNFIMPTPDYGLKYTEDYQSRRLDFPIFPGFHNLIEMGGPTKYRYVPERLKQYNMPRIHNQNKNKKKRPYHVPLESFELHPTKSNQLDDVDFSKEQFSNWENSHESYKRRPGSHLLNNMKPSTPMLKFRHYDTEVYTTQVFTTTAVAEIVELAEVPATRKKPNRRITIPNVMSFAEPDLFEKIDPLPYKQVKTRNQEAESDEDEDDERSKYLEYY